MSFELSYHFYLSCDKTIICTVGISNTNCYVEISWPGAASRVFLYRKLSRPYVPASIIFCRETPSMFPQVTIFPHNSLVAVL